MKALILLFLLLSCTPPWVEENDKKANQNYVFIALFMGLSEQRNYSLTDNNDGTLAFSVKNGFGGLLRSYTIKKCLQGQVYRSAQNDCQGAGTSANGWNASLLNYCGTNDDGCNPTGQFVPNVKSYVYGANSQIYTSCNNDTTKSLSWYVLNLYRGVAFSQDDVIQLFKENLYQNVNNSLPTDLENTGLWTASSYYTQSATFVKKNNSLFDRNESDKTILKYSLCSTEFPK